MADYDWSSFTKRIPIQAEAEDIFKAWTVPARLEEWFLRKAIYKAEDSSVRSREEPIQENDTYQWFWHGWDDEIVEEGTVLEVRENKMLRFVFGKAGIVEVSIKKEHGETICGVVQSRIPEDEEAKINYHMGCSGGWTFYLANLKSILEGGIDLRNKNVKLDQMINS